MKKQFIFTFITVIFIVTITITPQVVSATQITGTGGPGVAGDTQVSQHTPSGPYADFKKAIEFTSLCPPNMSDSSVGGQDCAAVMEPVGDGSYALNIQLFEGADYTYRFIYNLGDSAADFTDTWTDAVSSQRYDKKRTITVPGLKNTDTAANIAYNYLGHAKVEIGPSEVASGDTMLKADSNSYLTTIPRSTENVSLVSGNDTPSFGGDNAYNFSTAQRGQAEVRLTWEMNAGSPGGLGATVEGFQEFTSDTSQASPYGYRILRAKVNSDTESTVSNNDQLVGVNGLVFYDTVVKNKTGDTYWSPSRKATDNTEDSEAVANQMEGWYNKQAYYDTGISGNAGDTYVYTVLWTDAYGHDQPLALQAHSSGYDTFVIGEPKTVIFIVENFEEDATFGDDNKGKVKITPWVNGVPRNDKAFWAPARRVVLDNNSQG